MQSRLLRAMAFGLPLALATPAAAELDAKPDPKSAAPMERGRQPLDEAAKELRKTGPVQASPASEEGSSARAERGTTASARRALATGSGTAWSREQLVGHMLYSADDKQVGTIDDVVRGPEGDIQSVVLDAGDFLGLGSKRVAVPIEELRIDGTRVMASGLSRSELERMEEYTE